MKRFLLIFLVAIAALLIWALRPRPVPADFAVVHRGLLRVTVVEEGRTRIRDRYVISAPVPGRVQRITLEPGDRVRASNTVLALFQPASPTLIDSRTRAELEGRVRAAESAIGVAQADRERIKTELEFERLELARYRTLEELGVVARERVDATERRVRTLEEALRSSEFAIRTAEHQLEVARAGLIQSDSPQSGDTVIRLYSPVDGIVLRRFQESEAIVPSGHSLLEIGDLGRLEIVSDLLSTAAVRVQPDQHVLIEQWGGDQALQGRVRRIEPSGFTKISALGVEEQRVNVLVDFDGPEEASQLLGDGYRVEVRIVVWEQPDVLKVPVSALFRHEGRWAVYRLEEGQAVRRWVEIGERDGIDAQVIEGLEAGDEVIIYPGENISDGVAVVPRTW